MNDLREVASNADRIFETLLREKYPRADRFVWFRAREALRNGTADRFDRDMANDPQILHAHDDYTEALRDDNNEVLRDDDKEEVCGGDKGVEESKRGNRIWAISRRSLSRRQEKMRVRG